MVYINPGLIDYLHEKMQEYYPDRYFHAHCVKGTKNTNRYIQIGTVIKDTHIHYEYCIDSDWNGYVELHLEGDYLLNKYSRFRNYLYTRTRDNVDYKWLRWMNKDNARCRLMKLIKKDWGEVWNCVQEIIGYFDQILEDAEKEGIMVDMIESKYEEVLDVRELSEMGDAEVYLMNCGIDELFKANLVIPNYQRDYCWEDKQITDLWNNLKEDVVKGEYHLGTVILHKDKGAYNVIDGQQRLTTLTLILYMLGYRQLPLMKQKMPTESSKRHIANAKSVIVGLVTRNRNENLLEVIRKNLVFSVLIVNSSNLELAYTFFSNQNSRGVPLTDYDILKAHHLRYIYENHQAEHLSQRWNVLSHEMMPNGEKMMEAVVGVHLYRLRRWMRGYSLETYLPRYVKEEFSAAKIMDGIPPFGERFDFYEKIQGGSHFFAYVEQFIYKYKDFMKLEQVRALRCCLGGESHVLYADVIETLLFAYYLKFGQQYLSEALFCISGVMAQHRYEKSRTNLYKICEYARDSEIVMMIDQASSPTFFLAESLMRIRLSGRDLEYYNIQYRFYECLKNMFDRLTDISDKTIKNRIENEYK